MKYRDFAKDYEINYVSVPGKSRLKAIRVYKGPYFSFIAPPERIRFLRWYYFAAMILLAVFFDRANVHRLRIYLCVVYSGTVCSSVDPLRACCWCGVAAMDSKRKGRP